MLEDGDDMGEKGLSCEVVGDESESWFVVDGGGI